MKLNELRVGDVAVVTDIDTKPDTKRRLMDIGLARGTELIVRRFAPLGDPVEISLKDFSLALRVADAKKITVDKLSEKSCEPEKINLARHGKNAKFNRNRAERNGNDTETPAYTNGFSRNLAEKNGNGAETINNNTNFNRNYAEISGSNADSSSIKRVKFNGEIPETNADRRQNKVRAWFERFRRRK